MPRSLARSSPYWSSCRHSHSSIYRSTASRRNSLLAAPAVSSPRPPAPPVPRQLFLPVWRQLFLPVHLLFLAPLLGRIGTKAGHIEFQDDGMVHHPVDGGSGGHTSPDTPRSSNSSRSDVNRGRGEPCQRLSRRLPRHRESRTRTAPGGAAHRGPAPASSSPSVATKKVRCSIAWLRVRTARRVAWSEPVSTSVTVGRGRCFGGSVWMWGRVTGISACR